MFIFKKEFKVIITNKNSFIYREYNNNIISKLIYYKNNKIYFNDYDKYIITYKDIDNNSNIDIYNFITKTSLLKDLLYLELFNLNDYNIIISDKEHIILNETLNIEIINSIKMQINM